MASLQAFWCLLGLAMLLALLMGGGLPHPVAGILLSALATGVMACPRQTVYPSDLQLIGVEACPTPSPIPPPGAFIDGAASFLGLAQRIPSSLQ